MSKPYKAIQSKAMHNGAYIAYAKMDGTIYTTNGQIMVRVKATEEELKPLKNQLDSRDQEPMDMEFVLSTLQRPETFIAKAQDAEEWENLSHLKCTRASGQDTKGNWRNVSVQTMYIDYVNARFTNIDWWIGDQSLIATTHTAATPQGKWPTVLAVIARVKEDGE